MSRFGADDGHGGLWSWTPSWNIAPGAVIPVVAWNTSRWAVVAPMRWGLHPHWKKTPPDGRPLYSARLETAADKASFRTPFRRRRALVPARGWYAWEGVEGARVPYYIHRKDGGLTAFAALWDQWQVDEGITLMSVALLTSPAAPEIKSVYHRMPVRLPESHWRDWLDWNKKPGKTLAHICGGADLAFHPVSMEVNSGRAQGPELISPINLNRP